MKISEMNWMQVEAGLTRDDRAVLPIGSTEQHAHLSLATDSLLAERVACEAAEPLGVPVFPVIPYGIAPAFLSFPGSISLRVVGQSWAWIPPPRQRSAAADMIACRVPPMPIARWSFVPRIAAEIDASTSPSWISLILAPAPRISSIKS